MTTRMYANHGRALLSARSFAQAEQRRYRVERGPSFAGYSRWRVKPAPVTTEVSPPPCPGAAGVGSVQRDPGE